jgi:putative transcriptional regulator
MLKMTPTFDDLMNGLDEVDAFLAGKTSGYKVSVPTDVDVKSIRKRLNMTQARFSEAFGFSLDAVKHWEGGRRTPEASARAFLTVIAKNPAAVMDALQPVGATHKVVRVPARKLAARPTTKKTVKKSRPPSARIIRSGA